MRVLLHPRLSARSPHRLQDNNALRLLDELYVTISWTRRRVREEQPTSAATAECETRLPSSSKEGRNDLSSSFYAQCAIERLECQIQVFNHNDSISTGADLMKISA